jgi:hypothetical protein
LDVEFRQISKVRLPGGYVSLVEAEAVYIDVVLVIASPVLEAEEGGLELLIPGDHRNVAKHGFDSDDRVKIRHSLFHWAIENGIHCD